MGATKRRPGSRRPSHAAEMTSAYLDRRVETILARRGLAAATLAQKQELAAVIHLCGAAAGEAHARRGFKPHEGQRCGEHLLATYLGRVKAMQRRFLALAREGES